MDMHATKIVNTKSSIASGRINIIDTKGAAAIPNMEPKDTVLVITIIIAPKITHIKVNLKLTNSITPMVVATPFPPLKLRRIGQL
jgi:hypothetical protein